MLNRIMSDKNLYGQRGPFVADAYADVDEEEEEYGKSHRLSIKQLKSITLKKVNLFQTGSRKRDPQWWVDYLNELGIDKDNP